MSYANVCDYQDHHPPMQRYVGLLLVLIDHTLGIDTVL
jgi:hypothetical protein